MPFIKGQSGNPAGSPRKSLTLAEALRQHFTMAELMEIASGLLKSDDETIRFKTLALVWDRMFGKAMTTVEIVAAQPEARVDWSAVPAAKRNELLSAMAEVSQLAEVVDTDESVEH